MNPLWWFFVASALALIPLAWWFLSTDSGVPLVIGGCFLVAAIVLFAFALTISLERHFGRVACKTFSTQTGRETRFVIYTAVDGGDCLTPSGGKWIPTKNLREFGDQS